MSERYRGQHRGTQGAAERQSHYLIGSTCPITEKIVEKEMKDLYERIEREFKDTQNAIADEVQQDTNIPFREHLTEAIRLQYEAEDERDDLKEKIEELTETYEARIQELKDEYEDRIDQQNTAYRSVVAQLQEVTTERDNLQDYINGPVRRTA